MPAAAAPPRIAALDVVRGVAVMGILAMNILAFALPVPAYFNPHGAGPASDADLVAWLVGFVLFDGKMRGLFALLFGASLLLVVERADAAGAGSHAVHFRRMAWLLAFGLAHYYLVWDGDILFLYAATGMAAWFFCDRPPRALAVTALLLLAVQFLMLALVAAALAQASAAAAAPGASAQALAAWATMTADFAPLGPAALAEALALYRGSYAGIAGHRLFEQGMRPFEALIWYGPETLAYMLLGMAALKSGFLTGAWSAAAYRRTALAGFAIGIPAFASLAWAMAGSGFAVPVVYMAAMAAPILVKPAMVFGWAALILLLARPGGPLTRRIAAAGRTAFTNYLGSSIVMTTLFYGYGFGLFGTLGRAQLWIVVAAMWALMLAWSAPWLARCRYGPFEWLWRSLARARLQPMRR